MFLPVAIGKICINGVHEAKNTFWKPFLLRQALKSHVKHARSLRTLLHGIRFEMLKRQWCRLCLTVKRDK